MSTARRRRAAPPARNSRRGRRGVVRQGPLRTHWLLLTALLLTLAATLLFQGYTQHLYDDRPDQSAAPASAAGVPEAIRTGGPVIDSAGGQPRTAAPKPGTIALTFDDGPDPRWTPQVLDVLRRAGVHATFFVVGTQAAAHPELVRRIVAEGHQVGIHTFTHTDLGAAAPWRRSLELREAQLTLAGVADVTSSLLRPPYSSPPRPWTTPAGPPSSRPGGRAT